MRSYVTFNQPPSPLTYQPPSSWIGQAACAGRSDIFDNPFRRGEALALCATCPVRPQCRSWALHVAVDGVAGGLTARERRQWRREHELEEPEVSVEEFLPVGVVSQENAWRRGRNPVILAAVAERTAGGENRANLAAELGVTTRTVERLRVRALQVASDDTPPARAVS